MIQNGEHRSGGRTTSVSLSLVTYLKALSSSVMTGRGEKLHQPRRQFSGGVCVDACLCLLFTKLALTVFVGCTAHVDVLAIVPMWKGPSATTVYVSTRHFNCCTTCFSDFRNFSKRVARCTNLILDALFFSGIHSDIGLRQARHTGFRVVSSRGPSLPLPSPPPLSPLLPSPSLSWGDPFYLLICFFFLLFSSGEERRG